ncbi:MAG: hypothetical protein KDE53_10305 [Caldilineaceae bacterium]|nr:hypothetical protein [Caldilineaceae bacterium]
MRKKYGGHILQFTRSDHAGRHIAEPIAARVWFEQRTVLLSVEINGVVESIKFEEIPQEDFESAAPIVKFQ